MLGARGGFAEGRDRDGEVGEGTGAGGEGELDELAEAGACEAWEGEGDWEVDLRADGRGARREMTDKGQMEVEGVGLMTKAVGEESDGQGRRVGEVKDQPGG